MDYEIFKNEAIKTFKEKAPDLTITTEKGPTGGELLVVENAIYKAKLDIKGIYQAIQENAIPAESLPEIIDQLLKSLTSRHLK